MNSHSEEVTRLSEPHTPVVTVLVVNWNGQALLPDCLDALAKQDLDRERWECWVIDNASTDDSLTLLAERYPWARVVRNEKNLGFAGGNNMGLQATTTPFVALLNNDAHPEPDWLSHLVAAAEDPASADVAAWTSKVLFARPDGEDVLNNTGSILLPDGSGADRGYEQPDRGQYDQPEDVFLMSGTAVLLRAAALDQVGLFDPDFFMYYEDTDLSWRLQAAGWRIRYQPDAVVRHVHSASSVEWSPFFTFHVDRNRLAMLTKNAPLGFAARKVLRYQITTASIARRELLTALRQRRRPPVRPTLLRLRVTASYMRLLPRLLIRRWRAPRATDVPSPGGLMTRWVTERC